MFLEKQLIMTIGMTYNNWEITKDVVEKSINTFANKPIVYNKQQEFKDYSEKNFSNYKENSVIGYIAQTPNIVIEDNNVYADIYTFDGFEDANKWNGKFDNWCIQFGDNRKSFELVSVEVF